MNKNEKAGVYIKVQDLERTIKQIVADIITKGQEDNNRDETIATYGAWIGVMRLIFALTGLILTPLSVCLIFYDTLATRFLWQHSAGFGPAQALGVVGFMAGLVFLFIAYYKWRE